MMFFFFACEKFTSRDLNRKQVLSIIASFLTYLSPCFNCMQDRFANLQKFVNF